jgi:hypothetical protein
MDTIYIQRQFDRMGARVRFGDPVRIHGRRREQLTERQPAVIDIQRDRRGEYFDIRFLPDHAEVDVLDVQPHWRHLLLMVRGLRRPAKDKFLCGHDERAWFVAGVPDFRGISNVRTAMEALKPVEVLDAQARKGVKFRHLRRRRTAAYLRQGEWFFTPRPDLVVPAEAVIYGEPLSRGAGKPHLAEMVYRVAGEAVYVCRQYPNGLTQENYRRLLADKPEARQWGWQMRRRNAEVYARGAVRHPDHATIGLAVWHRVLPNTENRARTLTHLMFLD